MGFILDPYRFGGGGAFSPDDVSGLLLWIDVSDASTITFGTGTDVAQIDDKSGNGNPFVQATGAAQPPRDGTQNGLSTLQFDGVSHFIRSTSFVFGETSTTYTVFFAGKRAASGYTYVASGATNGVGIYLNNTVGTVTMDKQGVANRYSGGNIGTGTFFILSMTITATAASAWIDGTADQTDSYASTSFGTTAGVAWGAGRPDGSFKGTGDCGELLIYDSILSTSDRQAVENHLIDKWGV